MTRAGSLRPLVDAIGIVSSLLCAVHCLVVPGVLVMGPVMRLVHVDDEVFHFALLWVVLPAALIAFTIGCFDHKDRLVAILGGVGLLVMLAAFMILHEVLGESGERVAVTIASVLLIAAHARNYHLCRMGACRHDRESADGR